MNIKDDASLAMIPVAYKEDKLYSVIPNNDDGDFDFSRSSKGTRVNKGGFIEEMDNDIPRLDYPLLNGVVQDCPTILLEPQRTNLAQNSNELNTGWAHSNCTLTPNQVVAPDGSNTGSFVERTSTIQARVERGIDVTDQNYTWSCFVKKGNQRYAFISVYLNTSVVSVDTIFDFDTGSIVHSSSAIITNSVVEYSNGWYGLTTTFDALASQTAFVKVGSTSSTTVFSTGNVGDTIYVWGAQLEAGSYPTSYIPTQGEPNGVTRAVDNAQIASGAEDIIGSQNEGTLFIDLEIPYDTTSSDYFQFCISDQNTLPNRVFINFISGEAVFQVFSNSAGVGFCNTPVTKNIRLKIAASYETDNFVLFKDGFLADEIDTGGTVNFTTQMESIRFADFGNGLKFQAKVYETMFFKEALTQAELEALTSYDSFKEMATEQLYTIE